MASSQMHYRVNPEFVAWMRTDQALMAWLLASIFQSMLGRVVCCTTSDHIWITLEQLFTGSSRARVLQLCFQLQLINKGSMSINDYILKMRRVADNLNAAGQIISDEDLILYILGGLGSEYDLVVVNLTTR